MSTTGLRTSAVNKGDANALHRYAASLKKAAGDLQFQLRLANGPVKTYLDKQEGDWKREFKDTWNKISPDFDGLYCPVVPSLGEQLHIQLHIQLLSTGQWLESYAHEIDLEVANDSKMVVNALAFVGGIVVLGAVTLGTAGTGTAPTALALIGAGTAYGLFSFAAVNYADQVIDNSVVEHDASPWTDIDVGQLIVAGIEGGVVGGVTTAVALPLAGLLRVLGPVLGTGTAFAIGSTVGDVTGQLLVADPYKAITTGDSSHLFQVNPIEVGAAALTGLAMGSLGGGLGAARSVPTAEIGEAPGGRTPATLTSGQTELPGGQGMDVQPVVVNGPKGYQVGVQATFETAVEVPIDGQMARFPAGTQVVFLPGESPTSGTGWFTVPGAGRTPATSFGFQTGGPEGSGLTFLGGTPAPPGSGTSQPAWTPSDGPSGGPGPAGGRGVELAPSGTVTAQGRPYTVTNLETGAVTVYGLNDSPITITTIARTPQIVGGQVTISEIPTIETVPPVSGAAAQPLRTAPPNGVSAVDAVVPPTTGTAPAGLRVVPGLVSEPGALAVTPPSSAQPMVPTAVVQTTAGAAAPPAWSLPSQPGQRPAVVPAAPLPGLVMGGQQVPARQPSLPGVPVVSPGPLQAEFVAPPATGAQTVYALVFGEGQQVTGVVLDSPTGTAREVAVQVLAQPAIAYRILDGPGVTVTAGELAMSTDVIAVKFTVATDGTVSVLEHWTGSGQQAPSQVPGPITTLPGPQTWLTTPQTRLTVPAGAEVPGPAPLSVPLPWGPPSSAPPVPTAPPPPRTPSEVPPPVTTLALPPPLEFSSTLPVEVPGLSTQSMVTQPQTWVQTELPPELPPWPSSQTAPQPQPPPVFTWDAPEPDPARIVGLGADGEVLFSGRLDQDGTISLDGGGVATFVKDPDATSFEDGLSLAVQPDDSEAPVPQGGAGVVDADPVAGSPPAPQTPQPGPAADSGTSDVVVSLPNWHAAASSQAQAPRPPAWPQLTWGVPLFFAQAGDGQKKQRTDGGRGDHLINLNGGTIQVGGRNIPIGGQRPQAPTQQGQAQPPQPDLLQLVSDALGLTPQDSDQLGQLLQAYVEQDWEGLGRLVGALLNARGPLADAVRGLANWFFVGDDFGSEHHPTNSPRVNRLISSFRQGDFDFTIPFWLGDSKNFNAALEQQGVPPGVAQWLGPVLDWIDPRANPQIQNFMVVSPEKLQELYPWAPPRWGIGIRQPQWSIYGVVRPLFGGLPHWDFVWGDDQRRLRLRLQISGAAGGGVGGIWDGPVVITWNADRFRFEVFHPGYQGTVYPIGVGALRVVLAYESNLGKDALGVKWAGPSLAGQFQTNLWNLIVKGAIQGKSGTATGSDPFHQLYFWAQWAQGHQEKDGFHDETSFSLWTLQLMKWMPIVATQLDPVTAAVHRWLVGRASYLGNRLPISRRGLLGLPARRRPRTLPQQLAAADQNLLAAIRAAEDEGPRPDRWQLRRLQGRLAQRLDELQQVAQAAAQAALDPTQQQIPQLQLDIAMWHVQRAEQLIRRADGLAAAQAAGRPWPGTPWNYAVTVGGMGPLDMYGHPVVPDRFDELVSELAYDLAAESPLVLLQRGSMTPPFHEFARGNGRRGGRGNANDGDPSADSGESPEEQARRQLQQRIESDKVTLTAMNEQIRRLQGTMADKVRDQTTEVRPARIRRLAGEILLLIDRIKDASKARDEKAEEIKGLEQQLTDLGDDPGPAAVGP